MMLKRLGALFTFCVLLLASLGFAGCGGGGGGNNGGNNGGTVAIDATGEYFVNKFFATNTQDASKVVDAMQRGLSIYFTLKSDNTLTAGAQTPDQTPKVVTMTGTWSIDASNNLTIKIIDDNNNQRTIVGKLSQNASGEVTFEGSQTDGATIELDSSGGQYTITTLGLFQYDHSPTLADLAGHYKATSDRGVSNLDSNLTVDLLPPGDVLEVTINNDGSGSAHMVSGGQTDDVTLKITATDSFHLLIQTGSENPKPFTFSLIDGTLTVWNYDSTAVFPPSSTPESATAFTELQLQ